MRQAVRASRSGFPEFLPFAELLARYAWVVPGLQDHQRRGAPQDACRELLRQAEVAEARYRVGKTKVFLGVGVLDDLEKMRLNYLAARALSMQCVARVYLARKKLRKLRDARQEKLQKERAADAAKRRAEEEARAAAAAAEEARLEGERKVKESEEKDRQDRFRRARQLSFERKSSKKKREEKEAAAAATAAAAGTAAAAAATAVSVSTGVGTEGVLLEGVGSPESKAAEEARRNSAAGLDPAAPDAFAARLTSFQQELADGKTAAGDMMNVAVVSDIGWKNAAAAEEDVWAQYAELRDSIVSLGEVDSRRRALLQV